MTSGDDFREQLLQELREASAIAEEEEEAERAAQQPRPAAELAAAAIAVLADGRPWSLEERRALGLPPSVDGAPDDWSASIEELLGKLDGEVVVASWLGALEEGKHGSSLQAVAAAALGRIESVARFAGRLRALLAGASSEARMWVRDALAAPNVPIDPAFLDLIEGLLLGEETDRETAAAAMFIAGPAARRSRAVAAMVAARVRRDRSRRITDAVGRDPPRAVPKSTIAEALSESASPLLAATAMLELDASHYPSDHERWGRVLVAIAGEEGLAHLFRRMNDPGWGCVPVVAATALGEPGEAMRRDFLEHPDPSVRIAAADACPDSERGHIELGSVLAGIAGDGSWPQVRRSHPSPIDTLGLPPVASAIEGVTAESADLRAAAISNLITLPRPEHLLALLLALDLDRFLAQEFYGERYWQPDNLDPWLPSFLELQRILRTAARENRDIEGRVPALGALGRDFERGRPTSFELAGLATKLLDLFLAERVLYRTVPVTQILTPALEELLAIGPARFAERIPRPGGLTAEERVQLDAAEVDLAGEALARARD